MEENNIIIEQVKLEIKRLKLEILEKQKLVDELLDIINNSEESELNEFE